MTSPEEHEMVTSTWPLTVEAYAARVEALEEFWGAEQYEDWYEEEFDESDVDPYALRGLRRDDFR